MFGGRHFLRIQKALPVLDTNARNQFEKIGKRDLKASSCPLLLPPRLPPAQRIILGPRVGLNLCS